MSFVSTPQAEVEDLKLTPELWKELQSRLGVDKEKEEKKEELSLEPEADASVSVENFRIMILKGDGNVQPDQKGVYYF